jgi:ATP-dependent protease ClpP protease subunit
MSTDRAVLEQKAKRAAIAAIFILAFALFASKFTQPAEAMTYSGETRNDITYLHLAGEIRPHEASYFSSWLDANYPDGTAPKVMFSFDSPGGDVDGAMGLGFTIGSTRSATYVRANETCASSCVLLWAAGQRKGYYPNAKIGVHSATVASNSSAGTKPDYSAKGAAQMVIVNSMVGRLYSILGAPTAVVDKMFSTPAEDIYWLTSDDLKQWNATDLSALPQASSSPAVKPFAPVTSDGPGNVKTIITPQAASDKDRCNAIGGAWSGSWCAHRGTYLSPEDLTTEWEKMTAAAHPPASQPPSPPVVAQTAEPFAPAPAPKKDTPAPGGLY